MPALALDYKMAVDALESIAQGVPVEEKALPRPRVHLPDLFTRSDMVLARKHVKDIGAILEHVVRPRMEHINEVTGQENDDRYWAYALQWFLEGHPRIGVPFDNSWTWVKSS